MTALQNWLTPEVTRAAALALLHFLWQGAALAALASATLAVFRNAATRYALAVAFLAAMMAAPLLTFAILERQPEPAAPGVTLFRSTTAQASTQISFAAVAPARAQNPSPTRSLSWLPLLVEAWFLGVVLLSLRPAAGFVLVERLRRHQAKPIAAQLRVRCLALERRLGITRVIQYFESRDLQTPAAVGWFRPVIFLPLSAITGLSPGQLDAVITHELAHIKRLDSFVNLFQIAAETLLFYHPAVWWLSKRIRAERENCCDDVALSVCADPAAYARALASMAEWQIAPALAMAANRGPLAARVARVLGAAKLEAGIRGASLAASALCLTASLVAGQALLRFASRSQRSPSFRRYQCCRIRESQALGIRKDSAARALTRWRRPNHRRHRPKSFSRANASQRTRATAAGVTGRNRRTRKCASTEISRTEKQQGCGRPAKLLHRSPQVRRPRPSLRRRPHRHENSGRHRRLRPRTSCA